jgi:hypothetical protein
MGNKAVELATKVGDIPGVVCDNMGNIIGQALIKEVTLVPKCGYNLFSISRLLKDKWELIGSEKCLTLLKGNTKLVFDICIPTPKGTLYAIYIKCDLEMAGATTDDQHGGMKISVQQAHGRLGHCSEDAMRKVTKHLNWKVTGIMNPCDACAAGKAKQKNVPKIKEYEENDNLNRVFLDIATIKPGKDQPKPLKPVWRIMVDERTQLKFSDFFQRKNEMVEPTQFILL